MSWRFVRISVIMVLLVAVAVAVAICSGHSDATAVYGIWREKL